MKKSEIQKIMKVKHTKKSFGHVVVRGNTSLTKIGAIGRVLLDLE